MFINYFTSVNNSCLNFNSWGYHSPNFSFGYNMPIFNINNFTPSFNSYTPFFQQNFFNISNFNNNIWSQTFSPNLCDIFSFTKIPQPTFSFYQQQTPVSFGNIVLRQSKTNLATNATTDAKQPSKTEVQTTGTTNLRKTYTGSLSNYNSTKGNALAEIALNNASFIVDAGTKEVTNTPKDPQNFTGYCARYVQTAISDADLDDGLSRVGSAYLMTDILSKNSNFEEISASTPLKDLQPGTVIIYDRGVQGYSSIHGHVEIITKDGRAVSDAITDNLYKKPSHIFIPV